MNHSVKKLVTGAALVFAAFGAIAADPIKIGSVLSVTGPAAFLGDPELKTLQLYVADINKKDAYLVFVNFANATDVEIPVSREEWRQ